MRDRGQVRRQLRVAAPSPRAPLRGRDSRAAGSARRRAGSSPKRDDARRDDEELAAVGHREPRAVDRLVPEPRRAVLDRIEVGDAPPKRRRDRLDVDLGRERGGRTKRSAARRERCRPRRRRRRAGRGSSGRASTTVSANSTRQRGSRKRSKPRSSSRRTGASTCPSVCFDPVDGAEEVAALDRLRARRARSTRASCSRRTRPPRAARPARRRRRGRRSRRRAPVLTANGRPRPSGASDDLVDLVRRTARRSSSRRRASGGAAGAAGSIASPNISRHSAGPSGRCVPSAGMTSTRSTLAREQAGELARRSPPRASGCASGRAGTSSTRRAPEADDLAREVADELRRARPATRLRSSH